MTIQENYYEEEIHSLMTTNLTLESEVNDLKEKIRELQDLNTEYYEQIRHPTYDPFAGTCSDCNKNIEQYKKIRSAFDRRKYQHQAIVTFFKHYNFTHNGEIISLTKLIKIGEELQKAECA
jgi:hypothetical protein